MRVTHTHTQDRRTHTHTPDTDTHTHPRTHKLHTTTRCVKTAFHVHFESCMCHTNSYAHCDGAWGPGCDLAVISFRFALQFGKMYTSRATFHCGNHRKWHLSILVVVQKNKNRHCLFWQTEKLKYILPIFGASYGDAHRAWVGDGLNAHDKLSCYALVPCVQSAHEHNIALSHNTAGPHKSL